MSTARSSNGAGRRRSATRRRLARSHRNLKYSAYRFCVCLLLLLWVLLLWLGRGDTGRNQVDLYAVVPPLRISLSRERAEESDGEYVDETLSSLNPGKGLPGWAEQRGRCERLVPR